MQPTEFDTLAPPRLEHTPPMPPMVTILLQGGHVTLQSTIPPGADGWAQIRQLCYEGVLAAHAQILQAQGQSESGRIIVPVLGLR